MQINIGGNIIEAKEKRPALAMSHHATEDGRIRIVIEETKEFFETAEEFQQHCSQNDLSPLRWPFEQKDIMNFDVVFRE